MELATWMSEHLEILFGVPFLMVTMLVPFWFTNRVQRGGHRQAPNDGDSAYVPIMPDSADCSVDTD